MKEFSRSVPLNCTAVSQGVLIFSYEMRGTELVVLSACDTGLGEYRSGEGVFGLRRAFELAGARSLIMSLWRVPSGPTRELMQEFYRQLSLGKRRSQALREAQRILRRRYPETFYWGAFVLSGDPSHCNCSPGVREIEPLMVAFDECLNVNWFLSLKDAKEKIRLFKEEYNGFRPQCLVRSDAERGGPTTR